jgi:hypothetical protein
VNHKLSLELFRRAAELGDPEAQGALAMRMAFGLHHSNSFEGSSVRHFGRVRSRTAAVGRRADCDLRVLCAAAACLPGVAVGAISMLEKATASTSA